MGGDNEGCRIQRQTALGRAAMTPDELALAEEICADIADNWDLARPLFVSDPEFRDRLVRIAAVVALHAPAQGNA